MSKNRSKDFWFQVLSEKKNVQHLVQGLLQCACPVEVFDHYQVEFNEQGPAACVRLIVGNRLLLDLVSLDKAASSRDLILQLLINGREERDKRGLNRYRLVLIGSKLPKNINPHDLPPLSEPNIHLHLLDEERIKNTFGS